MISLKQLAISNYLLLLKIFGAKAQLRTYYLLLLKIFGAKAFEQLAEIVDAVGDKIDVICNGGIRRGTHVLKALSVGAKACSGGRWYLYALAAGGQPGVEKAISNTKNEIERDMKLMGITKLSQLSRKDIKFR
ncbi:MAG: alpha-hydroxy-acid oxidizing protein [Rivularia sp. (in: cyanobacteria)]|jgi:isopentenyl diphosphate isomerase/L-lactate dehydrogenase-like FMN-dependent dehydrogenase